MDTELFLQECLSYSYGSFNMPKIYVMGPTALLSLRRKSCYGFYGHLINSPRPGLNPRTLGPMASMLALDHRERPANWTFCKRFLPQNSVCIPCLAILLLLPLQLITITAINYNMLQLLNASQLFTTEDERMFATLCKSQEGDEYCK
jgi:hypothetical protein